MNKTIGHIHSIESFGTVDGPGVRLVVFFQGCPMRCLYCHNPDTWAMQGGKTMSVAQVLDIYEANKEFYHEGGITATGGEPMVQIDFLIDLFEAAQARGIHTCLDTSGITYREEDARIARLLACTNLVMLDIKHVDAQAHQKLTGQGNANILAFAKRIANSGVEIWVRHVIVPGLTMDDEEFRALGRFIAQLKTLRALDVLPYHSMGQEKYEKMGMEYPLKGVPEATRAQAEHARGVIMAALKEALGEEQK